MTLVIVAILAIGLLLIATENWTNINKAASAMFAGTVGWVLYVSYGTDFVTAMHLDEYAVFLKGAGHSSVAVKEFIVGNIFLKYVGKAAEIVLFLLATMTIVEILHNNGCFDFVLKLLRTRDSQRLLWTLSASTFILSANLDNLTTTVMMLSIMRGVVENRRQRMLYGSAVVVAANCGGAFTVIGDPAGLLLWNNGAVTATSFSTKLFIPCLIACALPTYLIGRMLPERTDTAWVAMPYRGDDTNLNVWQRLAMLFVGIGGLWFIPTFHNITRLSPFVGALCVLSVLWIVNEVFNRKLISSDQNTRHGMPLILQYGTIQMMLFVMGIMLSIGVLTETGALAGVLGAVEGNPGGTWIMGGVATALSTVLDNFATAAFMAGLHPVDTATSTVFSQNGDYWAVIAYASAIGGNIFCFSSMGGIALMKAERVKAGWYFKNVGWKAMAGALAGLAVLYAA